MTMDEKIKGTKSKVKPIGRYKSKNNPSKTKKLDRPYNQYNLFFILEREHLLQSKGVITVMASEGEKLKLEQTRLRDITPASQDTYQDDRRVKYEEIETPPLPPRYKSLSLPYDWFVHGKDREKNRKHRKSHGVATFKEISQEIGSKWRDLPEEDEVKVYVTTVARLLMEKRAEYEKKQFEDNDPCGKSLPKSQPSPRNKSDLASKNGLVPICTAPPKPDFAIVCANSSPNPTLQNSPLIGIPSQSAPAQTRHHVVHKVIEPPHHRPQAQVQAALTLSEMDRILRENMEQSWAEYWSTKRRVNQENNRYNPT